MPKDHGEEIVTERRYWGTITSALEDLSKDDYIKVTMDYEDKLKVSLTIHGQKDLKQKLIKNYKRLSKTVKCVCIPNLEIRDIYRICTFYLTPSLLESFQESELVEFSSDKRRYLSHEVNNYQN